MADAQTKPFWYARPVFYVKDVDRALHFYVDTLGFWKKWQQDIVCQVNRDDCEIILCQDDKRNDKTRLFIELNERQLAQLQSEIKARSIPNKKTWWGYDSIQIDDPDGNELLFPIEGNSPAS